MSRPGRLDQKITIQRFTTVDDDMGGQEETWGDLFNAWAMVRPSSGREDERFERLDGLAFYIFTIRNRRDYTIQDRDRIVWQGVPYNIRFPADPGGRQQYIDITAERGVAQ